MDELVRSSIEKSNLDRILLILEGSGKIMEHFLRSTDYYVFDWAMEIGCSSVLNTLLDEMRPEHHLLMLSHDGYQAVNSFMRKILYYETAQGSERIQSLLALVKRLASVDPEVKEGMQAVIQEERQSDAIHDPKMVKLLQDTLQPIFPIQKKPRFSSSSRREVRFFSPVVDPEESSGKKETISGVSIFPEKVNHF